MNKYEAAEPKNGAQGIELHAVGCADIAKKNRVTFGFFNSAEDAIAEFYADQISEGMAIADGMGDCKVMPCARAVR